MKKIYVAPVCKELTLIFETELCKYSFTSGSLNGEHYPGIGNDIDPSEDGPDVMHSKTNDDLWVEDDDE